MFPISFSPCWCSVAKSGLTLCDSMDCSTPDFPVLHRLLELVQTHVHRVYDAIQPSHPLSSPSPFALNLSQPQGLFQWVDSSTQVASSSISPSSEYSGLISFRIDCFNLLAVQGTLKSLLQEHNLKASALLCSAFFMVQLSHSYMSTGKTIVWLYGSLLAKWWLCFLICCLGWSQPSFHGGSVF